MERKERIESLRCQTDMQVVRERAKEKKREDTKEKREQMNAWMRKHLSNCMKKRN